jgi:hypothetical protein
MKPGQLRYKGHNVNPATFKRQRPDLRRLVGRCSCGVVVRGKEALPQPDPYSSEIYGNNTPVVQCDDCRTESSYAL